jgi:AAA15 family ATPase/GTPase
VLNSFSIRNFRLFQAIEVKRLGRVNLIVGKNNSGKSAFLEAVQVYASNASPSEDEDQTRRIFDIRRGTLRRRVADSFLERNYRYPWQLVPTGNMGNRKIAALWDLTSISDLRAEVISALQLIEPKVEGVAFVEDPSSRYRADERVPLVKIQGVGDPLPLKSMGDGMMRLFQIIVALANAQGGILLIDEFENGLHWSIQPLVWDVVFRVAERLNVQVFATTHSRDCIQGFDQAWRKRVDQGAFFRLDLKDEMVRVREYAAETLADALEAEVEVR